jgi:hypothetical protein
MHFPPTPQNPEDASDCYGGKHHVLDDRCVLLYERPLSTEFPPQADEHCIPQDAAEGGVDRELPNWHALDARQYRDRRSCTGNKATDQDGLPAMALKQLTRTVQIRLEHEFVEALIDTPDTVTQAFTAPEPQEIGISEAATDPAVDAVSTETSKKRPCPTKKPARGKVS